MTIQWLNRVEHGDKLSTTSQAYSWVPALHRAVNLRATALGTVPSKLYRGDNEVDWPFRQELGQLMQDTERSLLLYGAAYWLRIYRGRTLVGFRVLNPRFMSVQPNLRASVADPYDGVRFLWGNGSTTLAEWSLEDVVYFREPSIDSDVLPGIPSARVALQSAQLAHYLDRFASVFFESGAQPVTLMQLPEYLGDSEYDRIKAETNGLFASVTKAWRWMILRAQDIKVTKITPDINSMMMPELAQRALTDICMTMGVPRTMLEASAANYATADSDRQSFWRETIVPRLGTYRAVLNEQIFEPLGHELSFQPEALDVLQTDEAMRAGSLLQLVQAGVPLRGAMTILGYDQIEEALGPEPAPLALPEPPPPELTPPPALPDPAMDAPSDTAAMRSAEFELLAKKLERRIKAGKSLQCSFKSNVLSDDDIASVMERLSDGMTVSDVRTVVDAVKAEDMTPEEKSIFDRLIGPLTARGERWARRIMRGEDISDAEGKVSDITAPVLSDELGKVMGGRIDRLGNQFQPIDPTEASDIVQDWLFEYVPERNRQLDASTISVLKKAIAAYRTTPGMTIQDVMRKVAPATDRARARSIAITEVTRAAAQAEVDYQRYLAGKGIMMERTWITNVDEKVCPTCGPLHNLVEDEVTSTYPQGWVMEYPEGPPAHVNCRCSTALTVVRR